MTRNYKFHNPEGLYFMSFAVTNWLDVFTRNVYKNILVDSLIYCRKEKGMEFANMFYKSKKLISSDFKKVVKL